MNRNSSASAAVATNEAKPSGASVAQRLYDEAEKRKKKLEERTEQHKAELQAAEAAQAAAVREAQHAGPAVLVRESATSERLYRNALEQRERREKLIEG